MKLKQLLFWTLGLFSQLVSTSSTFAQQDVPVFIKEVAYVHRRIYELGGDCKLATVKVNDFCQFFGYKSYAPVFNSNVPNPTADQGYVMHTFPVVKAGKCFYFIDVNRTPIGFKTEILVANERDYGIRWVNKLHKNSKVKLTKYVCELSENNRHAIRYLSNNKIPHLKPKDYIDLHVKIGNAYGAPLACARQAYAVWLEAFIRGDYCVIYDLETNVPNSKKYKYWFHVYPAILQGKLITYIDSDIDYRNRYVPRSYLSIFLTEDVKFINHNKFRPRSKVKFLHFIDICDQKEIYDYMLSYRKTFPLQ